MRKQASKKVVAIGATRASKPAKKSQPAKRPRPQRTEAQKARRRQIGQALNNGEAVMMSGNEYAERRQMQSEALDDLEQLEPQAPAPTMEPTPEPRGFLQSLKETFSPSPKPASSSDSANGSSTPAPVAAAAPVLAPEIARALANVPDVIGEDGAAGGDDDSDEMELNADDVAGFLDAVVIEEQDVKDALEEGFLFLCEYFESNHWKLSERQLRMLGRPATAVLNSIWNRLKDKLPNIVAQWCETTPGAAALLIALGLVVVPKALTQVRISRTESRKNDESPAIAETATAGAERATVMPTNTPKVSPAVFTGGNAFGIPEATGIIGGK